MISEKAKLANERWREKQKLEFTRRQDLGLVMTSHHGHNGDHWKTQQEFLQWYRGMFGYSAETTPIWWYGTSSRDHGQTHTWLLPSEHHNLICKLAWS